MSTAPATPVLPTLRLNVTALYQLHLSARHTEPQYAAMTHSRPPSGPRPGRGRRRMALYGRYVTRACAGLHCAVQFQLTRSAGERRPPNRQTGWPAVAARSVIRKPLGGGAGRDAISASIYPPLAECRPAIYHTAARDSAENGPSRPIRRMMTAGSHSPAAAHHGSDDCTRAELQFRWHSAFLQLQFIALLTAMSQPCA